MRYPGGMRTYLLTALIVLATTLGACAEEKAKPAPEPEKKAVEEPKPAPTPPPAPAPEPAPEEPALDLKTPEEIEKARKAAMMEGKYEDAVKICELGGWESNEQEVLGCTLAACRTNKADLARKWAKPLGKALKGQAIKICHASGVYL